VCNSLRATPLVIYRFYLVIWRCEFTEHFGLDSLFEGLIKANKETLHHFGTIFFDREASVGYNMEKGR